MIRAEPLPGTVMGGFRRREVLEGTLIWVGNLGIMMGILTVKILKFQGVLDKDGPHSLIGVASLILDTSGIAHSYTHFSLVVCVEIHCGRYAVEIFDLVTESVACRLMPGAMFP